MNAINRMLIDMMLVDMMLVDMMSVGMMLVDSTGALYSFAFEHNVN